MRKLLNLLGQIQMSLFYGSLLFYGCDLMAQGSPENQLVQVFFSAGTVQADACDCGLDHFIIVQDTLDSRVWYVGGVFGSAVGLFPNGNLSQNPIPARSIVKAFVNADSSVTCFSMKTGADPLNSLTWGVSDDGSGEQKVETIVVSPAGDVFIGGHFGLTGTNLFSGNIGMYRHYDGWLHGHPFNTDLPVTGLSWDSSTSPGVLDVFGTFTSVCDGGSSESSTAHCYQVNPNQNTVFWNPSLLQWDKLGK